MNIYIRQDCRVILLLAKFFCSRFQEIIIIRAQGRDCSFGGETKRIFIGRENYKLFPSLFSTEKINNSCLVLGRW